MLNRENLLVVALPEFDGPGVGRDEHSAAQHGVEGGGEEGGEHSLHKQHGRVWGNRSELRMSGAEQTGWSHG